jgi:cobalt/nickel transport system ATP-binding protein
VAWVSSCCGVTVSSAEPRSASLLECRDLEYAYLGRFPALDRVSLTVERGQSVALLGANGCGKSTLLKLLDGLLFPAAGSYRAFGTDVTEDHLEDDQFSRAFRGRVGFIFQNSDAQVFSPTVRDEVAFGPLNMGLEHAAAVARVDDTLAMLDITGLADRAPYQLSGGEKKRVAIASVLAMNPEVLLFDEPTAALDPRTQHWMVELIAELHAVGKTIVLATHDLEAVPLVADRCVVLGEDHRVARDGPTRAVLEDVTLLQATNLVHAHAHLHAGATAPHAHAHDSGHH